MPNFKYDGFSHFITVPYFINYSLFKYKKGPCSGISISLSVVEIFVVCVLFILYIYFFLYYRYVTIFIFRCHFLFGHRRDTPNTMIIIIIFKMGCSQQNEMLNLELKTFCMSHNLHNRTLLFFCGQYIS